MLGSTHQRLCTTVYSTLHPPLEPCRTITRRILLSDKNHQVDRLTWETLERAGDLEPFSRGGLLSLLAKPKPAEPRSRGGRVLREERRVRVLRGRSG